MGICTSRSIPSTPDYRSCTSSFKPVRGEVENKQRVVGEYLPLYRAALEGKWKEAKVYLDRDPEALTAKITFASETALHVAVRIGEHGLNVVEKLVEEMSPEDLALKDQHGETPFFAAVVLGNIQAAKILINKNPELPNIPSKHGFPIHRAAQFSRKQMVLYLLDVTRTDIQHNPFSGENGGYLLIDVIAAEFYDVALLLIKRYPEIAAVEIAGLGSPLSILARKSDAFSGGQRAQPMNLRPLIHPVAYIEERRYRDIMESEVLELVKRLCEEIAELEDSKVHALLHHALHDAAKLGIPEIIEEIVLAYPPAIWFTDKDGYNVFQLAMLHRRDNVFNLIYQMNDYSHLITRFIDTEDNNMLHLVGRLPTSNRLSLTSPVLLVQREMQWFEEVFRHVHPMQRVAKNKQGKTPVTVFMEAHEDLMKRGAKWMKTTANSSATFATLIATVSLAGVLHVPGGTNSEGVPYLLHQNAFTIFVVADAISLISSIASILIFLSITTSVYSELDFYKILPRQLMLGIGTLLFSIFTTMIAFCFALSLLLLTADSKKQNLGVLYATALAILSLSLFPVYQYVQRIREPTMFGKKRDRLLH